MDMTFFHSALEHAWKVHSVLSHRALTKDDGTVQCPLGVHYGTPVCTADFRVLFCPVVMTYDNTFVSFPLYKQTHTQKESKSRSTQ
jgi:hypothetical protein